MTSPNLTAFLDSLCAPLGTRPPELRVAMIVAHPDDEVIGAGSRLSRLHPDLLHVTDGSPRDLRDSRNVGFATRDQYIAARREELCRGLALAGIDGREADQLGVVEQEAALDLAGLTQALTDWLSQKSPQIVLTHPYEGGHPDHDATAFAVHMACRWLEARSECPPHLLEMAFYHAGREGIETGRFLPPELADTRMLLLNPGERDFKQRLFACHRSQQSTFALFSTERECYRPAPAYDFRQPPHPGRLFYEQFPWGMTYTLWRSLAGRAMDQLGAGIALA